MIRWAGTVLAVALCGAPLAHAQPAPATSDAEAQLASLLSDLQGLQQEDSKLEIDLKVLEPQLQADNQTFNRVLKPMEAEIKIERAALAELQPTVQSLCVRTVDEKVLAAATAECHRVMDPYNARLTAVEEKALDHDQQLTDMQARLDQSKTMHTRRQEIQRRIPMIKTQIEMIIRNERCNKAAAAQGQLETSVDHMSACWNGARQQAELLIQGRGTFHAALNGPPQASNGRTVREDAARPPIQYTPRPPNSMYTDSGRLRFRPTEPPPGP
jgi:hypothetical protein